MAEPRKTRRAFLQTSAMAAASAPLAFASAAQADVVTDRPFTYEINHSDEEWRAMLDEEEYRILREMGTEPKFSSSLWNVDDDGVYACRGCGLEVYDNTYKEVLIIGWLFFDHAFPTTVMTDIDILPAEYGATEDMAQETALMEAHCRRCGSHLGHILNVQGKTRHCINGSALTFTPAAA